MQNLDTSLHHIIMLLIAKAVYIYIYIYLAGITPH